MDSFGNIRERGYIECFSGELSCVIQQTLHFFLRTTVAELQVIQHREVLHREPAIGILNEFHISAHLIGVIGHIRNRQVNLLRRRCGVPAKRTNHARGKARGEIHVVVRGHTCRLEGVRGILLNLSRCAAKQRINAADKLLILGISRHDLFTDGNSPRHSSGAYCCNGGTYAFKDTSEASELLAGFIRRVSQAVHIPTSAAGGISKCGCLGGCLLSAPGHINEAVFCPLNGVSEAVTDGVNRVSEFRPDA